MKFKRIYVEICNTCNLSCSFCASRPAHPRQMSVEQGRPYTDHLYLHLLGEPLMHPQLEAILQICQRASLHVQLTTNGTLLASRRELLEAYPPRQINISVHSFWEQPRPLCELSGAGAHVRGCAQCTQLHFISSVAGGRRGRSKDTDAAAGDLRTL